MIAELLPPYVLKALQRVDLLLLAALLLLMFLGMMTLYSANDSSMSMLYRQGAHFFGGLVLLLLFSQIQSKTLKQFAIWVYGIGLFMLILVLIIGVEKKGATRWLYIGIDFQPSEIMKLAVPMMVAYFFAEKPLPPRFTDVLAALGLVFLPMLLILKQPDLGTALLIALSGLFVIYLAGISWRWIGGAIVLVSVAAPLMFFYGMHDYQRQRVMTLFNPEQDLQDTGYHIYQSKIAIGSGGMYGKGWLQGDQSRLDFLPERHTDFIFAVFGEEFGFLGNLFLLSLYILIIWRGLWLATRGADTFARLLGGSLSLTFFLYLVVNTGMVSGVLPVVGVPLPLVSYGGTSILTLMTAFGMLMGLKKRKRVYQAED
ncbi:MAG: rod shape-determining protein RodA [Thiothrix nivea]|nr:MAG: rod shape-determining protein RodA [Thiothrix nivea]